MSKVIKLGVIGYPLGQSKSKIIHDYWAQKNNIKIDFQSIEMQPQDLESQVSRLIQDGYRGFSVTLPHKETIMDLCHDISLEANAIGAVNMIKIEEGKLYGTNTDAFGFIANLKEESGVIKQGSTALVLGAGGAARAIIYALIKNGISQIILTNRTRMRAEGLAIFYPDKIKVEDWDKRHELVKDVDYIVNTTSLGMIGQSALEMNLDQIQPHCIVCDIVYKPLITDLLLNGKRRGNKVVTGIGMLIYQAFPAFETWSGITPVIDDDLRNLVVG